MIGIIGAIVGDIAGSLHEKFHRNKKIEYNFELIEKNSRVTDDTVHTIAVADWLMNTNRTSLELSVKLKEWSLKFFNFGYGGMFREWVTSNSSEPYNSFGNGSAMRVSPVAWVAESEEECIELAKRSAEVTHNHPEGVKGAIAVAVAIYHNLNVKDKEFIKNRIIELTGYDLNRKYEDINYNGKFCATCQGTVPESIICWLESTDYEDCIRKAICLECDTDTQAAIAGSICAANPNTQVPDEIIQKCIDFGCFMSNDIVSIINQFNHKFIYPKYYGI